jgi:hypothetical protein
MKAKKFSLLIKHDLLCGMIVRWKYFIAAFAFFVFACMTFAIHASSFLNESNSSETLGFCDFMFNVFAGNQPFDISSGAGIHLSIIWFAFHSYLLFLTTFYADEDLKNSANSLILRVKSKANWWAGKFIWCILSVFIYYLLLLICIFLFVVFGKYTGFANQSICNEFFQINIQGVSPYNIIIVLMLLPFLISLSLASFHMMLSLIMKPIFSFIIGICSLTAAAFCCHPLLLFNFTMAKRNQIFSVESSINWIGGIISAFCLLTFSFFAGVVIIRKKDII